MGAPITRGTIKAGATLSVLSCGCVLLLAARSRDGDMRVLCDACSFLRVLDSLAEDAQAMTDREYGTCDAYDDDEPIAYG